MRAGVWVVCLAALPLCLGGPPACSCNGIINSKGQGECQTTYLGKHFCYVNKGKCKDQKKGTSSERYWSFEACKSHHVYGLECYGLKGDRCQFPFKYEGRTFNNCTTYNSENGAAWCATRVKGYDRQAVRGSLEDCSAPCDHGASPYEECPRSPVVRGRSRHCCTPERPCRLGEGDCDSDADCGYGLKCGNSNCAQFRPDNYARADCCYDPRHADQGEASCWYDGRKHKHGETFPAKDRCNDCVCDFTGEVICSEKACDRGYGDQCTTVGGADPGAKCIFPFVFNGVRYTDCTTKSSGDGKAWCSTKTDYEGHHIGGKGNWGHCPNSGCSSGGTWSTWASWSACSATCGGGERGRTRSCSGGRCTGIASETIRCNTQSCCDCGSWGAWGRCEGRCGGAGRQSRSRVCSRNTCSGVDTRSCTVQTCPQSCVNGVRVRKNVNLLTRQERGRLVSALQSAIDRGEYQKVGNFHGAPTNLCGGQPCCPHGDHSFLPWHRLFMVHMEEELGEALPYWDWTEDGGVPALWEGVQAPIQQPAIGECSASGFTSRSSTIEVHPAALKAGVEAALLEETFEGFSDKLSLPHNDLHVGMRCDMLRIDTAAYDPVFYLHHTYVDHVFAYWQELQRLRGHDDVPTVRGHAGTLAPFNNQRHNSKRVTLRNNRGRDTFEYSTNYCYEYQELKFDGLTPQQFHQLRGSFETEEPEFPTALCPACVPSLPSSPSIFIGLITAKMMPSGYTTFDLCKEGRCVEAGKKASFGSRNSNSSASQNVDSSSHRLTEYDVTDLVAEQGWDVFDTLEAVVRSSLVEGLPQPVIILRFPGGPGEVEVPRGQQAADYGDLLDRYNNVEGINRA